MSNESKDFGIISDTHRASSEEDIGNPIAAQAFPPRLIIMLEEIAGGSIWRYSDGASMVEDGKLALAWIKAHGGLAKSEEDAA